MALAAIIAVIHDIIITVGVYAVTGFEVTPATVVAFLTILGFSLYDTVVVFDKVKDNQARLGTVRGDTYSSMVNRSLNQVLMRSINTSIVALLPVASLLFVGTYVLRRPGAARLRARAVRRPAHRCLLVDLRGHADPGLAEGARAQVPGAARAGRRRPRQGRARRAAPPAVAGARRRARRRRGIAPPAIVDAAEPTRRRRRLRRHGEPPRSTPPDGTEPRSPAARRRSRPTARGAARGHAARCRNAASERRERRRQRRSPEQRREHEPAVDSTGT